MPIKYIGRTTSFRGKTLWEIVGNLKDFGVGRMVVRSVFERYPEPSYMKIVKVEAEPHEAVRRVRVWVEKVFRGKAYPGLTEVYKASYKTDYRLIPKDEQESYAKGIRGALARPATTSYSDERVLPSAVPMPPLLVELNKAILRRKGIVQEVPNMFPLKIKQGAANRAKVTDEPEKVTVSIGQNVASRLYEGLK